MWKTRTFKKALGLLRQQLLFLFIFFFGLTSLFWVRNLDQQFHEVKPAPIIIVGDTGAKPVSGSEKNRFSVSHIRNLIAPGKARTSEQNEQNGILELALLDLNQLKLNDVDDLINRLDEKLIEQRDIKQDYLRRKIDNLELQNLDERLGILVEYRKNTSDPTRDVDRETLKKEISDLSTSFNAVSKQVSDSREVLKEAFDPPNWNSLAISVFDKDGQLNIVYTLINVVLLFIVVYSLLFLVIQPFTRIFFLSGYTDVLGQRIQDALASGKDVAARTVAAPTLIAAASAIGIGSLAIAGGQLDHAKGPREIQTKSMPLVSDEYANNRASSKAIERVADSVDNLYQSVNRLEFTPGETTTIEMDPVVRAIEKLNEKLTPPVDYNKAFEAVLGRIGKPEPANIDGSLFGKISGLKEEVGVLSGKIGPDPVNKTVLRALGDIEQKVGNPRDTASEETIFGFTNAVKEVTDDTNRVVKDTNRVADNTFEVANETREISADNWRNQAGRNGKNLVTQTKILFSGERYAVSMVAVRQIKREMMRQLKISNWDNWNFQQERRLIAQLEKLTTPRSAMKRSELAKELRNVAGEETWREWSPLILRYTRVSR